MKATHRIAALALLAAAAVFCRPSFALDSDAARLVKAAYLFHFCHLVSWPDDSFTSPADPLRVGIMADDKLADELQRMINSRPPQGRRIVVSKIALDRPRGRSHLLFVDNSLRDRLPEILAPAAGKSVLTVTESEQALILGSMINLVSVEGTLRFEISHDAVARSGLNISSRLWAVSYRFSAGSPKFRTQ